MSDEDRKKKDNSPSEISRRDFLRIAGTVAVGVGVSGYAAQDQALTKSVLLEDGAAGVPASEGYLLVDTKKCQGCLSCMLSCSLAHEGVENLSLSRIQVLQNSFAGFPQDLTVEQCRQCVEPACLEACPTGALHADPENGNVRRVDVRKCIGCQACIEACTYKPGRAVWNFEKDRAQKCDLCADTPFWKENGPGGKQVCMEVCPVGAIACTKEIPRQEGEGGYKVNLRGEAWKKMGYPTED